MLLYPTRKVSSSFQTFFKQAILFLFLLFSLGLTGQEITVTVSDQVIRKIEKMDLSFSIIEPSTLDSDSYTHVTNNKNSEMILAELDAAGLRYDFVNSEMDSIHRMHPIKRKNVSEVRKTLHYKISLHSLTKIHKFSNIKSEATNLLITDFQIIDDQEENRMQQIVKDLHQKGKAEADIIAAALNKKVGKILRTKQMGKISTIDAARTAMTMPSPKDVTYLSFEITFEAFDN